VKIASPTLKSCLSLTRFRNRNIINNTAQVDFNL
jgi:hypothetical protein